MRKKRTNPTLNAGSMADIAFLLLIFFLVVTTIAKDKGIPVILPKYYEGPPGQESENNVLTILINGNDDLLVERKPAKIESLKTTVIDFVMNPRGENNKPSSTEKAVISLQNDVNTSYDAYVKVYSYIHEAYLSMRNEKAMELFTQEYKQLSISQKNIVLKQLPLRLSEADPFESP